MKMRQAIALVEGMTTLNQYLIAIVPAKLRGKVPIEGMREALQHFRAGHAMDNVNNNDQRQLRQALESMSEALAEIAEAFDGQRIALYRSIELEPDTLESLSEPQHVGIYWTYDPNLTMGTESTHATMNCYATPEGINWGETIPLIADGHEAEIRLIEVAQLTAFQIDSEDDPEEHAYRVSQIQYA